MEFRLGDKVVYPNQGVGIIEQISTRNLSGQPEMFYLLKLNGSGMRVMVPMTNVVSIGLRRVARNNEIGSVLGFLHTGAITNVPAEAILMFAPEESAIPSKSASPKLVDQLPQTSNLNSPASSRTA